MPCRGPEIWDVEEDTKREIDRLIRYLCAIMRTTDQIDAVGYVDPPLRSEIEQWWKNHKALDKARQKREDEERKREEIRQRALAKLTKVERKVLGL